MNEINDKKDCWSYSKVSCFNHCKYEFYLNYIVNDDDLYLSEGNYYAEIGSYVHEILEMIFNGELKKEDALKYYKENYDDNIFYKVNQSIMDNNFRLIADYFENINWYWIKN